MSWVLNTAAPEGRAVIDESNTGIEINGSSITPDTGPHNVTTGDVVEFRGVAINEGEGTDVIRLELINTRTGSLEDRQEVTAAVGEAVFLGGSGARIDLTGRAGETVEFEFRAGHKLPDGSFSTDSTYGC